MKAKYILLTLCLVCTNLCFSQKNLFDKYAEADNVTSVYISKSMFQLMMPAAQSAGLKLMNMAGKIEGLQVLTTEDSQQAESMRKDFSHIITKEHEELMRIRDKNTRATFHIRKNGENITEMLMLADVDKGYTIVQLVGNFTLQDIQEITSEINK